VARTEREAPDSLVLRWTVPKPPVFETFVDRLTDGLLRRGISLEAADGGVLREGGQEFGRVTAWKPGSEIALAIQPVTWGRSPTVSLRLHFRNGRNGCRISLEVEGWEGVFAETPGGATDWSAGTLLAAVIRELAPSAVGDWVTDRMARRPSGESSVATYRDPTYHWPNFLSILERIQLRSSDRLLEVACGGGAFLHKALESGCSATAIDHSPDMVRTARAANREAMDAGRAVILEGSADRLPVADAAFTCCVCTGAIGFFPDALTALREMHRALAPGGRLAVYASAPSLKGTQAAPEPVASRARFFEANELLDLARSAGFSEARVVPAEEEKYARKAGLTEEVVAVFRELGSGHLLLARKSDGPRRT